MMYNSLVQERLQAEHCQNIQYEFAQQRTLHSLAQEHNGAGRHLIGSIGRQLVMLGKWLEQIEDRKHTVYEL